MLTSQRAGLVVLRTLIGWHFLYEGYYKLMLPGWMRDGQPVAAWSAVGYLKHATGPFAGLFHRLAESGLIGWIDVLVPLALIVAGASLMLGLLTQIGGYGALAFLTLFYLSSIPTSGMPQPGAEGVYLLVSKNLIEWAAVLVIIAFRTGEIAGLDLLWSKRKAATPPAEEAPHTFSALAENGR